MFNLPLEKSAPSIDAPTTLFLAQVAQNQEHSQVA